MNLEKSLFLKLIAAKMTDSTGSLENDVSECMLKVKQDVLILAKSVELNLEANFAAAAAKVIKSGNGYLSGDVAALVTKATELDSA